MPPLGERKRPHLGGPRAADSLGQLGEIDPAWAGWFLGQGQIWNPANVGLEPGHLEARHYEMQLISELWRKVAKLEKALEQTTIERDDARAAVPAAAAESPERRAKLTIAA